MIKKSVFEEELIVGMQRELQAHDKKQGMENLVKAADYLHSAMDILEEAGLTVHADQILKILTKIAHDGLKPGDVIEFESLMKEPAQSKEEKEELVFKNLLEDEDEHDAREGKPRQPKNPLKVHDPHTSGLTSKKMVKNILEHGHPLNLTDDGKADDLLSADVGGEEQELEVLEKNLMPEMDFEDEV